MRIVLDTNVLVSGLLNPHGSPGRLLDHFLAGDITLLVDDRILAEYGEVLRRPHLLRVGRVAARGRLETGERLLAPALGEVPPAVQHIDSAPVAGVRLEPPELLLGFGMPTLLDEKKRQVEARLPRGAREANFLAAARAWEAS